METKLDDVKTANREYREEHYREKRTGTRPETLRRNAASNRTSRRRKSRAIQETDGYRIKFTQENDRKDDEIMKLSNQEIMTEAHRRAKTYSGDYQARLKLALCEIYRELNQKGKLDINLTQSEDLLEEEKWAELYDYAHRLGVTNIYRSGLDDVYDPYQEGPDLAQTALMEFINKYGDIDDMNKAKREIAMRVSARAYDLGRKESRKYEEVGGVSSLYAGSHTAIRHYTEVGMNSVTMDTAQSPERHAIHSERLQKLKANLKPKDRNIFGYLIQGYNQSDIARMTGRSKMSASRDVKRIKKVAQSL